jgi:mono/diheme cytochrome c family protein
MRTRTFILAAAGAGSLALAGGCSFGPRLPRTATGQTVLAVNGKLRDGPYALGEKDLAALPRRSLRGIDPATGREASFEGADLAAVLERADRDRGVDTVIARTRGRDAVPIPLWIVWQFRPVLADRADGAPLPALVLAWPDVEQEGLAGDPRASAWWAHGVLQLELVSWPSYARALAPPVGVPDAVRVGAGQFRTRCVACHTVRGIGGSSGPDLTAVGRTLDAQAFVAAVRGHRIWPAARPDLAPSVEDLSAIRSYLAAMERAPPLPPPDEPPEREPPPRPPPIPPGGLGPAAPP